jgi:hypothetical protein
MYVSVCAGAADFNRAMAVVAQEMALAHDSLPGQRTHHQHFQNAS